EDSDVVIDLFFGEPAAADLPIGTDGRVNAGGRHDLAIENNGQETMKGAGARSLGRVLGRYIVKQVAAGCIEAEANRRMQFLVHGLESADQVLAGDRLRHAMPVSFGVACEQEILVCLALTLFGRQVEIFALATVEQSATQAR